MSRISIVIPVLNEAERLGALRGPLGEIQALGHQVIIVDGGSRDDSRRLAREITPTVIDCARGRGLQMNAGAAGAEGELLLFLHADTRLQPGAVEALLARKPRDEAFWGRFDVRLDGEHWLYRIIESMMNLRSRLTGIATGDQAIFVSRTLFQRIGGFPRIPLMEDVALCKRLRKHASPMRLRPPVVVSTRRWAENGIIATTLLMWRLRLSYFLGVDPARLARSYYGPGADSGR